MAQLRLGHPEILKQDAEILQITHNTAEEARQYARHYPLTFPYLCDAERRAHEAYGIPLEKQELMTNVKSTGAAAADFLLRGERPISPLPFFRRYPGKDSSQAIFVLDREGVIRAVHTWGPIGGLPPASDLIRDLATLP